MTECMVANRSKPQAVRSSSPVRASYAQKVRPASSETKSSSAGGYPPESRADFLRAIRLLEKGGFGRRQGPRPDISGVKAVFVVCPYAMWLDVFGAPEVVVRDQAPHFDVWQQRCVDGPVRCVGHLPTQAEGDVIVVRVCLF